MNKRQKIVQQQFLDNEEAVLKRLKQVYGESLKTIDGRIEKLMKRFDPETGDLPQSAVYQLKYQKMLKGQVEDILNKLQTDEYLTVAEYLDKCYEEGFLGTMYDLQGQDVPLCFPLDQEAMVRAVQLDSKISQGLYTKLGEDVTLLKKKITAQVSRGIATGMSFQQVAKQLAGYTNIGYNRAVRIARTEGHRIQCQSAMDACYKAADKGADVVKQWNAALDARTRESHAMVDGEIRELDEKFSNGLRFPGDPAGRAAEVINCRCALNQRARWALSGGITKRNQFTGELESFESIEDYNEFKKAFFSDENRNYMNYVQQMEEKYGTKKFEKVLDGMNDREYKRYSKLLENNPMLNVAAGKVPEKTKDYNTAGRQSVWGNWEQYRQKFLGNAVPITTDNINDSFHNTIKLPTGKRQICDTMLETLDDLGSKYYSPLTNVIPMDKTESALSTAFASTFHNWESGSCTIRYNPLKFSEKGIERLKELSGSGYMPKIFDGDEIRFIVTHEYAHSIINIKEKLPGASRNFVQMNLDPYKKARKELEKLYDEYLINIQTTKEKYEAFSKPVNARLILEGIPPTAEEVATSKMLREAYDNSVISKYSLTNVEEFVAEGFADAEIGSNPNAYSLKVRDVITKYFGKG